MASIGLAVLMIAWFCGIAWSFSALIRELYESHREEWVMAGRPHSAPFYSPPGCGSLSRWEVLKLMVSWSIDRPEWADSSMRARVAVVVMRLCLLAMLAWVALVVFLTIWYW